MSITFKRARGIQLVGQATYATGARWSSHAPPRARQRPQGAFGLQRYSAVSRMNEATSSLTRAEVQPKRTLSLTQQ